LCWGQLVVWSRTEAGEAFLRDSLRRFPDAVIRRHHALEQDETCHSVQLGALVDPATGRISNRRIKERLPALASSAERCDSIRCWLEGMLRYLKCDDPDLQLYVPLSAGPATADRSGALMSMSTPICPTLPYRPLEYFLMVFEEGLRSQGGGEELILESEDGVVERFLRDWARGQLHGDIRARHPGLVDDQALSPRLFPMRRVVDQLGRLSTVCAL
jgi:hypothetical protein